MLVFWLWGEKTCVLTDSRGLFLGSPCIIKGEGILCRAAVSIRVVGFVMIGFLKTCMWKWLWKMLPFLLWGRRIFGMTVVFIEFWRVGSSVGPHDNRFYTSSILSNVTAWGCSWRILFFLKQKGSGADVYIIESCELFQSTGFLSSLSLSLSVRTGHIQTISYILVFGRFAGVYLISRLWRCRHWEFVSWKPFWSFPSVCLHYLFKHSSLIRLKVNFLEFWAIFWFKFWLSNWSLSLWIVLQSVNIWEQLSMIYIEYWS